MHSTSNARFGGHRPLLSGVVRIGIAAVVLAVGGMANAASTTALPTVTVMTRNLYLGADLSPAVIATTPQQLIDATTAIFVSVQQTNFHARAQALADEIEATEPDLVGLQEVALWRSAYPATGSPIPSAAHVEYDFLADLLAALEQRGLHYAVPSINGASALVTETDVQAPGSAPGRDCVYPVGFAHGDCEDFRYTDRDAILVRLDGHGPRVQILGAQTGTFANNLTLPLVNDFVYNAHRGWVAVDAMLRGRSFRTVSAHLELDSATIQEKQAAEISTGPASTATDVIFLCDCNSPADGSGSATYAYLMSYGFTDAWTAVYPDAAGYTCCQSGNLLNPVSQLSARSDLIWYRGSHLMARDMLVVGAQPSDRTPSGLWPSDHAGVAGELGILGDDD